MLSWATGNAVTLTTTGSVVIDGLKFAGTHVTGNTGQQNANLTFTNSVFELTSGGNGSNNFYLSEPQSFTFTNNLARRARDIPARCSSRSAIPTIRRTRR